jgi:hypothetical protein
MRIAEIISIHQKRFRIKNTFATSIQHAAVAAEILIKGVPLIQALGDIGRPVQHFQLTTFLQTSSGV